MNRGESASSLGPQAQVDSAAAAPAMPATVAAGKMRWSNKTVLLLDSNRRSRESRAKILRAMGVRVECVPTAEAARAHLQSGTYNLVLVDPGTDSAAAESLVKDIKAANSRQLVGFLIGSPLFIATSLNAKSRPARVAAAVVPTVPVSVPPQTSAAADFGQRVRDAEAEQAR